MMPNKGNIGRMFMIRVLLIAVIQQDDDRLLGAPQLSIKHSELRDTAMEPERRRIRIAHRGGRK